MTADTLRTLERIAEKPGTTHHDLLTISRRIVRHFCELRRAIRAERHALRRQARTLRQSGPFTQRLADALEQQAHDYRAEELASVVDVLEDYGRVLVLDREGYVRALGFEALADLPNINRVDRERAPGRMVPPGRSGCHRGAGEQRRAVRRRLGVPQPAPTGVRAGAGLYAHLPTGPVARAANGWPRPQAPRPGCSRCQRFACGGTVAGSGIQAGIYGNGCWPMQVRWCSQALELVQHELGSGTQATGSQAGSHGKGLRTEPVRN